MRGWRAASQRLVWPSATQLTRAQELLQLDPDRYVHLPNGFDPGCFDRRPIERLPLWRQLLVERPCGWCPGGEPGSVAYAPHLLRSFAQGPVLLYVGRFTAVNRLGLLITAYIRAQVSFAVPAPLALIGAVPADWDGEPPPDTHPPP